MTVYRVLTKRLRVQRGPGNADLVVERPHSKPDKLGNVTYRDSDKDPTLVEFDSLCQVDIEGLLRLGAITVFREDIKEDAHDGESTGT